jgi:hypothetical protein
MGIPWDVQRVLVRVGELTIAIGCQNERRGNLIKSEEMRGLIMK